MMDDKYFAKVVMTGWGASLYITNNDGGSYGGDGYKSQVTLDKCRPTIIQKLMRKFNGVSDEDITYNNFQRRIDIEVEKLNKKADDINKQIEIKNNVLKRATEKNAKRDVVLSLQGGK